jgi:arginase
MTGKNMFPLNHYIGYASGIGARYPGCEDGPSCLFKNQAFKNTQLLHPLPSNAADKYIPITELCSRLSEETARCVQEKKSFAVIGGDHSCAIGTWSGAAHALRNKGDLGLIWLDAHLDAHTPQTTPSGNIHGMSVAALLGYGHSSLTHIQDNLPKIKPENLCMIGIRSCEPEEQKLIRQLNIRVFSMEEVLKSGLERVFAEAVEIITRNTAGYGLSLDIDFIDPREAPGTGTREKNGITAKALHEVFKKYYSGCHDQHKPLLGIEIAEFDPHRDIDNKTLNIVSNLLKIFA